MLLTSNLFLCFVYFFYRFVKYIFNWLPIHIYLYFVFIYGIHTVLFYLLHAILAPTSKKFSKDHAIKDSQNSFIIFKNSVFELEEYITIKKKMRKIQFNHLY